jgi:UDP-glucose 4-epimerase
MTGCVLVTGGAGFIGSHLVDRLIADGHHVTVLDDFSSGRRENLFDAERSGALRVIDGSVLDRNALDLAVEDCLQVYHLAVQCVRRSLGQPLANHEINASGTLTVLEAARRAGVERFVYCSSSEVYGNCGGDLLDEGMRCAPVTVYGAAKLAGEYYTSAYHQTYGLPVVIVRPFNAYGPREHERGDLAEVIPRFVIRALSALPPIIFGSGANGRDFTYVIDTARGIAAAAACDALVGSVVNIGSGQMITIRELAEAVVRHCGGAALRPIHLAPRPGDVLALRADTRLARDVLGYRPEIGFEEGLGRYVEWFRAEHDDPSALLEEEPCNWQMPVS